MKYGIIPCLLVSMISYAQTEKETEHANQVWVAYLNQTRLSDRWGLWLDIHLRTKERFVEDLTTFIGRVGLTYYLTDQTKLTAGYAFVNHFPQGATTISQPEHRPWQQIQWHTRYPRSSTMQYIRLEERFRRKIQNNELASGYSFNFRVRYNFLLQLPLTKKGLEPNSVSLVLNDEIHINMGEEILYNYFDQNRLFLGFAYQVSSNQQLQLGYMNMFQQLSSGHRFRNVHAIRLYYLHNVDWRRRE